MLWTANTERFCDVAEGLNDTAENLLRSINADEEEVSPSTIFAVASVLEGVRETTVFAYLHGCQTCQHATQSDSNRKSTAFAYNIWKN